MKKFIKFWKSTEWWEKVLFIAGVLFALYLLWGVLSIFPGIPTPPRLLPEGVEV